MQRAKERESDDESERRIEEDRKIGYGTPMRKEKKAEQQEGV